MGYETIVDDYNCVRHPPRHGLSESTCEKAHKLGVPMRWVCRSSLKLRWNVVCPSVGRMLLGYLDTLELVKIYLVYCVVR
jgi:hypothetical protein